MRMYIFLCVGLYVYIYCIHMLNILFIYKKFLFMYVCMHIYLCVYVRRSTNVCVYIGLYISMLIYLYICVYIVFIYVYNDITIYLFIYYIDWNLSRYIFIRYIVESIMFISNVLFTLLDWINISFSCSDFHNIERYFTFAWIVARIVLLLSYTISFSYYTSRLKSILCLILNFIPYLLYKSYFILL